MSVNLKKSPTELLDIIPLTKDMREQRHKQYSVILSTLKDCVKKARETEYGAVNWKVFNLFMYKLYRENPSYLIDIDFLKTVLLYIGYSSEAVSMVVRNTASLRHELNSSRNSK